MKYNSTSIQFKQVMNLGDYNSVALEVGVYGTMELDETLEEAIDAAMLTVKQKVAEHLGSALPVRAATTGVTEKFAGKVVR